MKINCFSCCKDVTLSIIVHETQGEVFKVPVPSGRGNRLTFVLKCLTEGCQYSRIDYEERAFEMEDIT